MSCSARWTRQLVSRSFARQSHFELPRFLCPALARPALRRAQLRTFPSTRQLNTEDPVSFAASAIFEAAIDDSIRGSEPVSSESTTQHPRSAAPLTCPGCGAYSQTTDPDGAGYYSPNRLIRLRQHKNKRRQTQQGKEVVDEQPIAPICSRCNSVMNNNSAPAIHNPSIRDIYEVIASSPHSKNHVYHVIDAADFPLSMVRDISGKLELAKQRTRNRRAKSHQQKYPWDDKRADITYIITRADLLAPTKEKVDRLMPYFVEVLRDAMGRQGEKLRLGNVHCVSSTRGWWTTSIKNKIVENGGAGWMVGKVNVGKSLLLTSVFPKGIPEAIVTPETVPPELVSEEVLRHTNDFLPPAQAVVPYPHLPTVSGVPGTTALPIRIPFHGGKGELVDLPGIDRFDLTSFVKPEHRSKLLMTKRIQPAQQSVKSTQSLLLGGIIRLSPVTNHHFLMYPYVTLHPHIGSTEKMIGVQNQTQDSGIENIALPEKGESMVSAGTFKLTHDVTKQRAAPLLNKTGYASERDKRKVGDLPFVTYSTDILLEGLGWVEIVADVRRRHVEAAARESSAKESDEEDPLSVFTAPSSSTSASTSPQPEFVFPEVEVFVPKGLRVGSRKPMGAWMISKQGKSSKPHSQPRWRKK